MVRRPSNRSSRLGICCQFDISFVVLYLLSGGTDFIRTSTNVPGLEMSVVTICATLDVIDDSILEDDEQLLLSIPAGCLVFEAVITILDTLDSECITSHTHTHTHTYLSLIHI